jgi:hypothetical protein
MLSRKFKIQNVSFAMPRDQPATTYYILTDKRSPSRGAELCSHDFVCFCSESLCTSTEGNAGSWVDRPLRPAMLKEVLAHIILISTKRLLDLAPKRRVNEDCGNQSDFRGAHEPRKTSSERSRMDARK